MHDIATNREHRERRGSCARSVGVPRRPDATRTRIGTSKVASYMALAALLTGFVLGWSAPARAGCNGDYCETLGKRLYPCQPELSCSSLFGTNEIHVCYSCGVPYVVEVPSCCWPL